MSIVSHGFVVRQVIKSTSTSLASIADYMMRHVSRFNCI